jgi:hypothetical protein
MRKLETCRYDIRSGAQLCKALQILVYFGVMQGRGQNKPEVKVMQCCAVVVTQQA